MSIGFLDLWSIRCHTGAYPPSSWDHLEFVGSVYTALIEIVGHALIFWGFTMFLSDAILGHTPLVLGTIWSLLVQCRLPSSR